jgi:hypothetical protein
MKKEKGGNYEMSNEKKSSDSQMSELQDGWWNPISPSGKQREVYSGEDMREIMERVRNDPDNWADM